MDGTYYKFKQIMELVEQHPNDFDLGEKVREIYWNQRKEQQNPNQLKIQFPEDITEIADEDIDKIARRAED
jgi:hypothetical protein